MRSNENATCANFGDPRLRDRELTHKQTFKKWQFLA